MAYPRRPESLRRMGRRHEPLKLPRPDPIARALIEDWLTEDQRIKNPDIAE